MIKVDGISLTQFGVSVDYNSPENQSPEIRTNFADRGVYGSINYGTTHGNANFQFDCFIKGDYRTNIKEIMKCFIDPNGDYKEVRFEFDKWKNRYYKVMLTKEIVLAPITETLASFSLEVTASVPFAQSIYATEKYLGDMNLSAGALEIPIQYYGTYRTGFELSFFGTISYFDIEVHSATGSPQVFHYVSGSHSTFFECDFNEFTINDNGTNGLVNASGDFPYINRATTKIVLRGDMTGSMNFKYRELYV